MLLAVMAAGAFPELPQAAPPPRRRERPARARQPRPSETVYFRNCAEARAAARRNIRRGEPGYCPALDRDNDGVACEPR